MTQTTFIFLFLAGIRTRSTCKRLSEKRLSTRGRLMERTTLGYVVGRRFSFRLCFCLFILRIVLYSVTVVRFLELVFVQIFKQLFFLFPEFVELWKICFFFISLLYYIIPWSLILLSLRFYFTPLVTRPYHYFLLLYVFCCCCFFLPLY